jgi:hypothetical protein
LDQIQIAAMARDNAAPDRVQGSQLENIRLGGRATLRTDLRDRRRRTSPVLGSNTSPWQPDLPAILAADEMMDRAHIHPPLTQTVRRRRFVRISQLPAEARWPCSGVVG